MIVILGNLILKVINELNPYYAFKCLIRTLIHVYMLADYLVEYDRQVSDDLGIQLVEYLSNIDIVMRILKKNVTIL